MKNVVFIDGAVPQWKGSLHLHTSRSHDSKYHYLDVFEELKSKLMAEGLFDAARKREIPLLPKKIGLVTSETGAAVRDMIRVARRRNPNIGILIAPCAVQGAAAVPEIVRSIRRLNENGECDVLLVGRGGGSIEDLWAFNEEAVARAIASSRIPVISCVGHEIDFTIADFVADLRAPTPSAAAEMAVPVYSEISDSLENMKTRLANALANGQRIRKLELERLADSRVLSAPRDCILSQRREVLERYSSRLQNSVERTLNSAQHRFNVAQGMLRTLDPNAVIDRGYAVVSRGKQIITSVQSLFIDNEFELRMADGVVRAHADCIEVNDDGPKETDL